MVLIKKIFVFFRTNGLIDISIFFIVINIFLRHKSQCCNVLVECIAWSINYNKEMICDQFLLELSFYVT